MEYDPAMGSTVCNVMQCPAQMSRLALSAKLFRGLSDPTRLAILQALCRKPQRVVDLCVLTGRAQPNVSAHLANLREVGLIEGHHAGRETYYSVRDDRMVDLFVAAEALSGAQGLNLCSCEWLDSIGEVPSGSAQS